MTKRNTFQAILGAPFRWPTKGEKPFVVAEHPQENAQIFDDDFARLATMMAGYKMGADIMVAKAETDHFIRDMLVNPIIFNYRHFLELSLKYLISHYGPPVGVGENWNTHNLVELWEQYLIVQDQYGLPDPDEADPAVDETIAEFSKIDPNSFHFRYPKDTKGRPLPLAIDELHLRSLADCMEAISNYFDGCDGALGDLRNEGP